MTFTGREIAKILGIQSVHGKFYQRLKIAMDRFIPLRFGDWPRRTGMKKSNG